MVVTGTGATHRGLAEAFAPQGFARHSRPVAAEIRVARSGTLHEDFRPFRPVISHLKMEVLRLMERYKISAGHGRFHDPEDRWRRSMCLTKTERTKPEDPSEWMRQAYPELRRIAAQQFHRERSHHTWQPTELVHEVFLRLSKCGPEKYANRAHFFAAVARAMRRTLIEHARKRHAKKRGGAWHKVSLDEADLVGINVPDFVALDAAFERLYVFDARLHQIAELRVFAGLSTHEIAITLKRGNSTVRRDWSIAKTWLQRDLEDCRQ